jgi:hypothetical protein
VFPFKIAQENIENLRLKAKEYHVHYCFHNDIGSMIPLHEGVRSKTGRQIDYAKYWKKPTVSILKEDMAVIKEDTEWSNYILFQRNV